MLVKREDIAVRIHFVDKPVLDGATVLVAIMAAMVDISITHRKIDPVVRPFVFLI